MARGTFEASAASSSAPGDFASWTSTGEPACKHDQTCFRQLVYGRQASSLAKKQIEKTGKMNELIFPVFSICSAVRFAHRAHGKAVLPGNGGRRKSLLAEIPQQERRQTQPSSVPSWAPRRNAPVRPPPRQIPIFLFLIKDRYPSCSCVKTDPARCSGRFPPARSAGIGAWSGNRAGTPGSWRCPSCGPRF